MLNKTNKLLISTIIIINAGMLNAQYAYIINDKDGYTNIRKKPNAKSQIVGKAYKYEVFFSIDNFCENELFSSGNWIIVSTNEGDGYIYEKNILELSKLPVIEGKGNFDLSSEINESIITGKNDSITLVIKIESCSTQFYNEETDNAEYAENLYLLNEITEIEINDRGRRIILPKEKVNTYCNVSFVDLYIGNNDDLYLHFGGGDGEPWGVWMSIVDGKIVYYTHDIIGC